MQHTSPLAVLFFSFLQIGFVCPRVRIKCSFSLVFPIFSRFLMPCKVFRAIFHLRTHVHQYRLLFHSTNIEFWLEFLMTFRIFITNSSSNSTVNFSAIFFLFISETVVVNFFRKNDFQTCPLCFPRSSDIVHPSIGQNCCQDSIFRRILQSQLRPLNLFVLYDRGLGLEALSLQTRKSPWRSYSRWNIHLSSANESLCLALHPRSVDYLLRLYLRVSLCIIGQRAESQSSSWRFPGQNFMHL